MYKTMAEVLLLLLFYFCFFRVDCDCKSWFPQIGVEWVILGMRGLLQGCRPTTQQMKWNPRMPRLRFFFFYVYFETSRINMIWIMTRCVHLSRDCNIHRSSLWRRHLFLWGFFGKSNRSKTCIESKWNDKWIWLHLSKVTSQTKHNSASLERESATLRRRTLKRVRLSHACLPHLFQSGCYRNWDWLKRRNAVDVEIHCRQVVFLKCEVGVHFPDSLNEGLQNELWPLWWCLMYH